MLAASHCNTQAVLLLLRPNPSLATSAWLADLEIQVPVQMSARQQSPVALGELGHLRLLSKVSPLNGKSCFSHRVLVEADLRFFKNTISEVFFRSLEIALTKTLLLNHYLPLHRYPPLCPHLLGCEALSAVCV